MQAPDNDADGDASVNTVLLSAPPEKKTAAELKAEARRLGVKGCSSMTRDQLEKAIEEAGTGV